MSNKETNVEADALDKKLIRQVEFYFGDFNLHRDKFMQEQIGKNDGWFSMDTMLKFKRLSEMCSEPGTILAALKKSKNNLLEVDVEGKRIRRKPNKPVPENDEKYRRDLKQRTVYIKGFPQTETIEDLTDFLQDYGKIDGIQLRRFSNPHKGQNVFKGSLFATFSDLENAEKFLQAPMVYYKDNELEKKTKDEFWKEKEAENADRPKRQKHKKITSDKTEQEGAEDNQIEENSWVYVSNLTDDTISHLDIKQILQEIGATECKFFSRFEKNGPEGYMLFVGKDCADEVLSLLEKEKGGCTVTIKGTDVKFEAMNEEKGKIALKCYETFRDFRTNKGKRFNDRKKRPFKNKHHKFADGSNGEPAAKQAKSEA